MKVYTGKLGQKQRIRIGSKISDSLIRRVVADLRIQIISKKFIRYVLKVDFSLKKNYQDFKEKTMVENLFLM